MPDREWYGAGPAWFVPLERDAFRLFGHRIRAEYSVLRHASPCAVELSCGAWIGVGVGVGSPRTEAVPRRRYHLDGVGVAGPTERVPVVIEWRPQRYLPAGALQAVSDDIEAPRRRSSIAADRFALTAHVSEIQSHLDFYRRTSRTHPPKLLDAYVPPPTASKAEAGPQMAAA